MGKIIKFFPTLVLQLPFLKLKSFNFAEFYIVAFKGIQILPQRGYSEHLAENFPKIIQ